MDNVNENTYVIIRCKKLYLVIDFEKKVVSSVSRAPPIDDGVNYVFAGRQVCAPVKLEPENESRYELIFKVKFN